VGDHDYWAGLEHVEPALENNGIVLLRNENARIPVEGDTLLLTGITHVYSKPADSKVVEQLASDSTRFDLKLMASHQISEMIIDKARNHRYSVALAGHTHGGQIRVPLLGRTYSASDLETPFISGLYEEDGLFVNVNNGLGFTLAPVRYNAPPAITLIELNAVQ
jgi:predicted MPP superfamily phosphohydrolase